MSGRRASAPSTGERLWPAANVLASCGRTWVSRGRVPSICNAAACLMWHSAGVSAPPTAAPSGVVTFLFSEVC